jgi:hypothetical protein
VRGQADAVGKQFTEIRDAQTRRARHFFAAQLRREIRFHQSDSPPNAAWLRPHMVGIQSGPIVFTHTPAPKKNDGAVPKSEEGRAKRRYDNDVRLIEKNILARAEENLAVLMADGEASNCITDHKEAKQRCQSTL